ncbi:MAG: VOC family protein [Pseudomonadota bacterium]
MTSHFQSTSPSVLLTVKGASDAIEYYCAVFGCAEMFRLTDPTDGRIGNAELRFGDGVLMLADEYPEVGALGPHSDGGQKARLHLYVPDVDAVLATALANGAQIVRPLEQQFFGDRVAVIEDPFGHEWMLATKTEAIRPEVMQQRWNDMMKS